MEESSSKNSTSFVLQTLDQRKKEGSNTIERYNEKINLNFKKLSRILGHTYKSIQQAKIILGYLRTLPFFEGFMKHLANIDDNEEALIELSKRLMLERIPAKTYVFRQGDPSNDKFYIIMQGSISVIVKHDKNVFNQEYFEQFGIESANALLSKRTRQSGVSGRRESKFVRGSKIEEIQALSVRPSIPNSSKPITNFSKKQMTQNAYVHNPTIMSDLISHMGVKTKEMYAGEAFGEKALLNKDAVRSTTILTNVDTDFIIMSKEDYLNIVRKYDKRRLKKAEFMKKNIPAIEHIVSEEIWDDMYHLIKEADFSKDSLLTEEGDFGTVIFFLCEGFCQLTKKVVAEYEKDKELHPKERILVEKTVNLVGAGSILGEEILYDDQPYRYTITVHSSTALIYYIERNQFLMRFPSETCRAVLEHFERKEILWRTENLEKAAEYASKEISEKRPITTYLMGEKELVHSVSSSLRTKYAIYSKVVMEKNAPDVAISEEDMNELRSRILPSIKLENNIGKKDYQNAIIKAREQKRKFEINRQTRSKSPLQTVHEVTFSPKFHQQDYRTGSLTARQKQTPASPSPNQRTSPHNSPFFKTEVDENRIERPRRKKFSRFNDPNSTLRNAPPKLRSTEENQEFAEKYLTNLEYNFQKKTPQNISTNYAENVLNKARFDFGDGGVNYHRLPSGAIVRGLPKKPQSASIQRSKTPTGISSSDKVQITGTGQNTDRSLPAFSKMSETPQQNISLVPSFNSIQVINNTSEEIIAPKKPQDTQLESALIRNTSASPLSSNRKRETLNRAKTALRLRKIVHPDDEKVSTLQTQQASFDNITPTYLKTSEIGTDIMLETKRTDNPHSQALVIKSFVERDASGQTSNKNLSPKRYASPISRKPALMRPLLGSLPPGQNTMELLNQVGAVSRDKEQIIHESKGSGIKSKKKYIDSLNPKKQKLKFFLKAIQNHELHPEDDESHFSDAM